MAVSRVISALAFGLLCVQLVAGAETPRTIDGGFGDRPAWHVRSDDPWWALIDLRDMLNLFHPFCISETGKSAGAAREFVIPAEWKPPFALRFYCADDYFADPQQHKPGKLGTESFFEHRFKQVLINEVVLWERDVTDENQHGSPTVFEVDLTPHVTPGKPFQLTFRVVDRVSTRQRNPQDVWFIGGTWYTPGDGKTEQPPRFHTAVWFADPVLGETQSVRAAPLGSRPHESVVAARHRARWPLPPRGERMASPIELNLVSPAAIPAPGFPLTVGIPVPPSLLRDASAVQLTDSAGQSLPVQTQTTGVWPDGSVRWLLLEAIAPASAKPGDKFSLRFGQPSSAVPSVAVEVREEGSRQVIETGKVSIDLGANPARLLDAVRLRGSKQPLLSNLRLRMSVLEAGNSVPVLATVIGTSILERGPVAACIESTGGLAAGGRSIGRFTFRVFAYAGLPTIQTTLRIFNDVKPDPYRGTLSDPALNVVELAVVGDLSGGSSGAALAGVEGGLALRSRSGTLRLQQTTADDFTADLGEGRVVPGTRASGWISTPSAGGRVQAAVWRFRQQAPKSLAAENGLEVALFSPTPKVPAYRPRFGEAKRHDLWFTFGDDSTEAGQPEAWGLLVQEPPRLFDRTWFCGSGGVAVLDADWFQNYPQIAKWVEQAYGDVSSERVHGHFGIRDFGDIPYSATEWRNGYWARVQGALNWGLASGDSRWVERSSEAARHLADVDTVHLPPGHPDWHEWNGLTCALGIDHSVHGGHAKWPAFQLGESLLLHYWMTGDRDSRDAGLANADYVLRQQAGLGSSEARSQARPILTLLRAWQATGHARYREAAARYVDLTYQKEHVIDWRRGAYIQPTYENWRCVSAGLDSMFAHNLYEYYRLTGDVNFAQLVVAIADSVYAESMLPQEEGLGSFLYYVRYSRNAWYYPQMAMLFLMAYDLTEDLRFLRAGRAAFARYLLCTDEHGKSWYQPYDNFGWLDPEVGGWLREFAAIRTEPFTITTQTPVPDPARYQGD